MKDFPQTGFVEVRYDDQKKYVSGERLFRVYIALGGACGRPQRHSWI